MASPEPQISDPEPRRASVLARPSRGTLQILVVDDEPTLRELVADVLADAGHHVVTAADAPEAMRLLAARAFDVVLTDIRLPGGDGLSVFRLARRENPGTEVILMTAYGDVDEAVASIKEGALDYLTKPFELDEITTRIERVVERRRTRGVAPTYGGGAAGTVPADVLLGGSPAMTRLRYRIESIAQSDAPVLIVGEAGTGKELVARHLHELGPRRTGPFVTFGCAAFPESILATELFGHDRVAVAGAARRREGRLQSAQGGTLFLDDLSELSPAVQDRLLAWLVAAGEAESEPVGSAEALCADVRIVTASEQRPIEQAVAEGRFRQDLLLRLATLDLALPPLRERRGDLPLLVERMLAALTPSGGDPPSVSPRAWAALADHRFPANLRELRHALEHARVLARSRGSGEIALEDLPDEIAVRTSRPRAATDARPLVQRVKEFELECLMEALRQTGGRKALAARRLGISRKSLWKKMRQHGLAKPDVPDRDSEFVK